MPSRAQRLKRPCSIWIGYDPREGAAFFVARDSVQRNLTADCRVRGLILSDLRRQGLYRRPHDIKIDEKTGARRLYDPISEAPMATEFAISRFLVPFLCPHGGWALFMDADMLVRADISELFRKSDPDKAVHCVKHKHRPPEGLKMDGQLQTFYARKNWSSFLLFNCDHPANARLTLDMVNTLPGRDLHALCWLADNEIGELGPEWNWLVGHSSPEIDPKVIHFTEGGPWFPGFEDVPFARDWLAAQERLAY